MKLTELSKITTTKTLSELNSSQVKELQTALNFIDTPAGPEDGICDEKTIKAFADFKLSTYQKEPNLIGVGSIKALQDRINNQPKKITKISDDGIKMIANFEGKRNSKYLDAVGLPTIGIGHLIKSGEVFNSVLTDQEVFELFRKDVSGFEKAVARLVKVKINQNQFNALVSFAFNCGIGALESSTLLRVLNEGNYQLAADNFLKWDKGDGKTIYGLTLRRQKERELFLK